MTQICTVTQGFGLLHRQAFARMLLTHIVLFVQCIKLAREKIRLKVLEGVTDRQTDRQMDIQTDISLHMETISTGSVP